jgi:hypothetical protein
MTRSLATARPEPRRACAAVLASFRFRLPLGPAVRKGYRGAFFVIEEVLNKAYHSNIVNVRVRERSAIEDVIHSGALKLTSD